MVATLGWSVFDPNGDQLTCRVDLDGDGTFDRTIVPCNNASRVLIQADSPGTTHPVLEVSDGVSGSDTRTTTLTVTPGPSEPFDITLQLAADMAPEYQAAFRSAADRWAQVIVAGWPTEALTIPDGFLGWIPGYDGNVDDLVISARDLEMDGPSGLLGHAGALLTRSSTGQPYFGVMEFDTADLARLAELGRLQDVILHEMGHVLGMGTNWVFEGRIDDLLTDPSYNGPAAVAAWQELGGTGGVPIEDIGGVGTAAAHWRERTFENELMTGFSDPDERLSRITIGALADRGYGVDLDAADAYSLPSSSAAMRPVPSTPSGPTADVGHTEPLVPYADGRLPTM